MTTARHVFINNDILTSQRSAPAKFVNAVSDHWKQSFALYVCRYRIRRATVPDGNRLDPPEARSKRVKLQKEAKPLRGKFFARRPHQGTQLKQLQFGVGQDRQDH